MNQLTDSFMQEPSMNGLPQHSHYKFESCDTNTYCNTCRIQLTSVSQAGIHYEGSKHRNKVKLLKVLEDATNTGADGSQPSSNFNNPDVFCQTCRVKFTSSSQAQMHYSGAKHRTKQTNLKGASKRAVEDGIPHPEMLMVHTETHDSFCNICRVSFTSVSQATMHYGGAKHKNKIKCLEEARTMSQTQSYREGEPLPKKNKFLEMCKTCNVMMTCPDMASAHYNGSKHQKRLFMLSKHGEDNAAAAPMNQQLYQNKDDGNVNSTNNIAMKGGHLYCSFCHVTMNSQTQMDAHRAGSKHKSKVDHLSPMKPLSASFQPPMVRQMTQTMSYAITPRDSSSFYSGYMPSPLPPLPYSS